MNIRHPKVFCVPLAMQLTSLTSFTSHLSSCVRRNPTHRPQWNVTSGRTCCAVNAGGAITVLSQDCTALQHFVLADVSQTLFDLTQDLDSLIRLQLTGANPSTFALIFAAGLFTSLSPCTLSVLPLTIGYIGGYSDVGEGGKGSPLVSRASAFAFGLATTLALLGVGSSLLGKTYGQIGSGLPIAVSVVAILMGLNLLEVVQIQLPSLDVDTRKLSAAPVLQAYFAGLTFALVASPCSTPILATLLAFVSSTQDPLLGGALLLAYTSGYVGPLLVAATFTGALKQVMALRRFSSWITPTSGVMLLAGGTYGLLSRTIPG